MKHLTEDELIELYYGEGTSAANAHLKACRECSRKYAEFTRSLEEIRPAEVPQRSADYGERVWQSLRPQLIPYEKKTAGWRGWGRWRGAAWRLAARCCWRRYSLAGAIGSGARRRRPSDRSPQATQRVVLVVLTDHLDRTERLLVQLEHSESQTVRRTRNCNRRRRNFWHRTGSIA